MMKRDLRMVTIKDIAEKAGVSTTTVSNVIHGKTKKVSPANVKKIQNLINEMGYVQKLGLRVLNNEKSQLIAVVINSHKEYEEQIFADPFYGRALGAIERSLRLKGYYMMFYSSDDIDDIFKMVMAWNVDGVIALTFSKRDCEKLYYMIHKPVISIDAYGETDDQQTVPNVGLDDFEGGYLMVQYLLNCGYENIYVCASKDHGVDHLRWLGAKRAFEEDSDKDKKRIQFVTLGKSLSFRENHYQQMARQIPFKKKTVAFFLSDLFALEAISHFSDQGIKIPEQIGVAGYDDISYARFAVPRLTTIHQDIDEKANYAVNELLKCLNDKHYKIPLEYKLTVRLIARQSV
ncbi:MAG: LacI family DNA-binding transcriptional regulator [Lachnospiraceae bacterium]|nr:LacI family DNA-binding transcriptional regulator [Lachnospiraceae bacterium]